MPSKILTLLAAALLLGACESTSEDTSGSMGTGVSSGSSVASQAPAPGSQEELAVQVGDRVFFGFDRSDLDSQAQQTVQRLGAWMQRNSGTSLTIEGHADERGTREYNLALGDRRAQAVADYLTALGVSGSRLNMISYGEERPAVMGSDEGAWAQNRRAFFRVN